MGLCQQKTGNTEEKASHFSIERDARKVGLRGGSFLREPVSRSPRRTEMIRIAVPSAVRNCLFVQEIKLGEIEEIKECL